MGVEGAMVVQGNGNKPNLLTLVVGLMMFSLGFGASQLTIAGDVNRHDVEIKNMWTEFRDERDRVEKQISELVGLMTETVQQNRELLAVLRAEQRR